MPESRTVCSFRAFYRTITPIYTRLQSIDITNWSLEPSIHPASSLSVNGPFLYFPDVRLVDVSRSDFPRLNNPQAGATLVFRFRHFLCPSFSFILLRLLSLRISHWLSFFLHVSAFAASRHLFHISQGVYPLGRPPYLPDRSLDYINRIFRCRRQFGD